MCGAALWDNGTLKKAVLIRSKNKDAGAAAWYPMALAVSTWVEDEFIDDLVIELPQIYKFFKGDPQDLIQLAGVVGAISQEIVRINAGRLTTYLPRAWKGQVKKDVTKLRVQKRLSPEELIRVSLPAPSLQHNVWDSLGIGLHFLGR